LKNSYKGDETNSDKQSSGISTEKNGAEAETTPLCNGLQESESLNNDNNNADTASADSEHQSTAVTPEAGEGETNHVPASAAEPSADAAVQQSESNHCEVMATVSSGNMDCAEGGPHPFDTQSQASSGEFTFN